MENELDKMTAVEWLWEQIDEILPFSLDTETGIKLYNAKEQAKEMEKENTIAFADKYDAYVVQGGTLTAEHYYEEKYGK
jgi:hypothetical protein